ncbi:MAG: hypothetical protein ACXIUD_09785 [Mongoliitalea sp.]
MKNLIFLLLTSLLWSCGNKSAKVTARHAVSVQENYEQAGRGVKLSVSHQYGAALSGLVPLPFPHIYSPLTVPIQSDGIDLTLTIDSTGIRYEAKAHPVSRTQTVEIREQQHQARIQTESQSTVSESVKTKRGFPWYWVLIGIVLVVAVVVWKVFKTNFKLF